VSLRNYAWIEANRRTVDRLSGGRVAYVYLADMYEHGYSDFNRQYFAQAGKVAAVIDVRFNSGGLNGDHIIDHLRHPLMSYWHMRYGRDLSNPQAAIFGPKVLLINEMAGSGAETFAWMFRKGGLGPLIGKRTWGGLVGMYTHPRDLLDGGTTWNPNMAFYNPAGTWDVEGHGVDPDLDIELDPKAMRAGHDMQLEGAVTKVLGLLETAASVPPPRHPPYPNHYPKSGR
jgi:tricorn protease